MAHRATSWANTAEVHWGTASGNKQNLCPRATNPRPGLRFIPAVAASPGSKTREFTRCSPG